MAAPKKSKPSPHAPVAQRQAEPRFVSDVRRPARDRPTGRRVLILCEGAKTETGCFNDIRKSLRLEPDKIIVLKSARTDPLSIVQEACAERAELRQERRWADRDDGTGDAAWAVFDGDEHTDAAPDRWRRALALAQEEGIRLAVSNPAFEYWYLLHFQDQSARLHRDQARTLLKTHLPGYEKSDVLYRTVLRDRTEEAIRRAKSVARLAELNGAGEYENPCSTVFALVELILSLGSEDRR